MKQNQQIKKGSFTVLLFLLVASISTFAQSMNVAYIYCSDTIKGTAYKTLLDSSGFSTDLIDMWNLNDRDFSNYSLIIIDADNAKYGYTWPEDWMVSKIKNTDLPILGLGFTGQRLYEKLELGINWGQGAIGTGSSIQCVDTSSIIYKFPNNFAMSSDTTIILYNSLTDLGVEYGTNLPASVNKIGQDPDNPQYYSITSDLEKYWLWGFEDSPDSMTQIGKDLFVNIVSYMITSLVSVDDEQITQLESFKLNQNYPNPFNPSTTIRYNIPDVGNENIHSVRLTVYNILGAEIATLVNQKQASGSYEVSFNASNLTSGIYFYKIISGEFSQVHKMMLIK